MIHATLYWRGIELWPVAMSTLALVIAGAIALYPPQVRHLGRPWRIALPLLRALALAALGISILRPVLTRQKRADEQGIVILGLDHSLSMAVRDRTLRDDAPDHPAAVGQLAAIAESMGLLPDSLRSQTMGEVYRDLQRLKSLAEDMVRTQRELDFARLSNRRWQEAEARRDKLAADFLATAKAAEEHAKAAGSRFEHLQRLAKAPRAIDHRWIRDLADAVKRATDEAQQGQDSIDESLYRTLPAIREPCDELSRLSRLELCWRAIASGKSSLLAGLDRTIPVAGFALGDQAIPFNPRAAADIPRRVPVYPDAPISDLSGDLGRALRQVGRLPVQAIILFSDGRQVGGSPVLPANLPPGLPIFTVSAAAPKPRDLAIDRIDLPASVFVNEPIPLRASVRALNLDPRNLTGAVSVSIDDQPPATQPVTLKTSRGAHALELPTLRIADPGVHRIRLHLPEQPGEADLSNNQAERPIKVLSQKIKILALASAPSWDFRCLRNALGSASWIDLREAILTGHTSLALKPQEVYQHDLIVLDDLPREALTTDQWNAIRQFVTDRGGSLLLIPGITQLAPRQKQPHPLASLLPFSDNVQPRWRTWPGQTPYYHAAPVPSALPALSLDDDPELSRRRWDDLGGFYRYIHIPRLNASATPLLVERQSRAPLLTEQRIGAGRAFFLGINETWRWRKNVGDRDQQRFYLQLVRRAADQPYAATNGPLSLDIDRLQAEPDQTLTIRARLALLAGESQLPRQLELSILHDGELVRTLPLLPAPGAGAGRYQAAVADLPPGNYELKLPTRDGEDLALPLLIARNLEPEMADLSGDRDSLQRLADATGGQCLSLDQVPSLPRLLAEARQRRPRIVELHLWDSAYLFLFALSCLTAEWSLRKRFGLA